MSFVKTQPEILDEAALQLQSIGSMLNSENAAEVAPTTAIAPAAADEVSAWVVARFSGHAQLYHAIMTQAAAIHEQFVATLQESAGSYAATEAANAAAAG